MRDAIEYAELRENPNCAAFLHMIRVGEGTADGDGYRRMFGGELFDSFADHPRKAITKKLGGRPITSTAAGAPQFLARTWDECAKALGLRDFSPANQDIGALFLIDRRKALDDVLAGHIEQAIRKCAKEWASLPTSPYGQPVKTMEQALAAYRSAGGELSTMSTKPQGEAMPLAPFIAAALPAIIEAAPKLGALFGSGSDVAERNVKAAEIVVGIAKDALGAKNEQEAVDAIKADPQAAQAVRQAVEQNWYAITEVGGGVQTARKADTERMAVTDKVRDVFKSHSFWVALLLLPLVYLIVGSVVGLWGKPWDEEVRSAIGNGVIGLVLGSVVGYYFGQTTSRNRTQ
jgi:muramidase (phage lysozyme)